MYDILRQKNLGLKRQVVEFAQQLVRTPSPSLNEQEISCLILKQMKVLGYEQVIQDEYGNIAGIILGRESFPTILLNCHMDSVSPRERAAWENEPYSGKVINGRLYGCGAGDCKGGLAAQIFACALLNNCLLPLKGNVIVAATVGEEQGASVGICALMERTLPELELNPDYAILGEPTDLGLYYGHDGWIELDIQIEGTNDFDVDDAAGVIFKEFNSRTNRENIAEELEELVIEQPHYERCYGFRRATIGINQRFRDSQIPEAIIAETKHKAEMAIQSIGNIAVDVAIRRQEQKMYTGITKLTQKVTNAWCIDPFCELMERARHSLEAANCKVRPGRWKLGRVGMATAGGVLTKNYKIPVIGYGPGNEEVIHGPNEYVEVDKIVEAVYGTAAIIHSLIGVPVFGWTSDDI